MGSEDNLSKVPVIIKAKNGLIQINAEIQDTHPLGSTKGNLYGLGKTPYHDYFTHTNEERLQFVTGVLKNLNVTCNFIFVGHSRGSENALKLATLLAPSTIGTILINPLPVLPYRGLRENYWFIKFFGFVLNFRGTLHYIFSKIALTCYNWLYSKNETNAYVVGSFYQCMSTINLRDQLPFIDKFNTQKTKLLITYAGNDSQIETLVSKDFVSRFEIDNEMIVDEKTPDDLAKFRMMTFYQNGMTKLGCFFKAGNHYLQKCKADFLVFAVLLVKIFIVHFCIRKHFKLLYYCKLLLFFFFLKQLIKYEGRTSGIFVTVYFVEAIAGFYITTNIVNIERQFQIPSKISGTMVSASDFGYIPSVIFVSYLGSKGNRAKWIGSGCMLIGLANLMIAYSHFLFPSENMNLTSQAIETGMERDFRRLKYNNIKVNDFLKFFTNESNSNLDEKFINTKSKFLNVLNIKNISNQNFITNEISDNIFQYKNENLYNSPVLKVLESYLSYCNNNNDKKNLNCDKLFRFLKKYNSVTPNQLSDFRQLVHSSYAFCDAPINKLRKTVKQLKCNQNFSAIGPTVLIFSGLFILGIGRTVPFSLGLPLMDDNVKKKNLPLYFAIMFLIRVLGPSLAFALGSKLNQYYYQSEIPPGMGVRDPMWIGKWWLGFVIIGISLLIPSAIMFFFPTSENKEEDGNEMELKRLNDNEMEKNVTSKPKLHLFDKNLKKNEQTPMSFGEKISDFKQAILECFKMPVFISATFGRCIDVFAFKGFFIFMNKYLEIQYDIPQYLTNRYIGVIFVSGFATGAILGSIVMKLGKLEGRKAALWVGVCSGIAASMTFMNTLTGCESVITKLSEAGSLNNFNFTNNCINSCVCENVPLYPVCDEFGKAFYSPCHAGCKPYYNSSGYVEISKHDIGSDIVFNDCSCTLSQSTKVSRDFCKNDECETNLKYYFLNMGIGGFFGGLGVVPAVLISLRSVPSQHRSIALGFQGFVVSLFATLPSSPAWGTLIDKFCRMWNDTCDGKGSCIFFDTHNLRIYLHTVYGCIRIFSLISDVLVFIYAKDLKLSEGLDDIENNEEGVTETALEITNEL
ncbi:Organic anion transporter polypeptide OATP family and Protein of unknown function DUF1057 family and Major facilitator superfamily domain, general substrate transporter-containing protein [Strongyloides ratti]|uniref:Solute carrier organic anion transporter family member n=1 Tax=Strongyloides ratti TaxID=34506 RepID=A0A090L7C7_STRRB|nr:Organic anion transporter polypeptide OATP family and Protein of unknown function DUF1057 family and Major facilitator superfamily domain, general substrate transporter-containing protein [Strongyloides ratti]CEF63419.1 Organic anion transporter polypeptide OATP family and Protein of unknown function DUF1057 family and Major facilitator superfamily domain, general substrate transporter-containing protein [Strongyloides ratti]